VCAGGEVGAWIGFVSRGPRGEGERVAGRTCSIGGAYGAEEFGDPHGGGEESVGGGSGGHYALVW
jgi:hypothetical protein